MVGFRNVISTYISLRAIFKQKKALFEPLSFFSPFSSNILPFLFLFINFFSSNIHYFSSNIHYFFSNIPYFLKISIIPMNIHFSFEYPLFNQISTIFLKTFIIFLKILILFFKIFIIPFNVHNFLRFLIRFDNHFWA